MIAEAGAGRVRTGTVVVGGVRLGYTDRGDPSGTPFLLVHGSGSNSPTWDRFATDLQASGHRSIALGLRGHAGSDGATDYHLDRLRDDVLAVLETLDLTGAVLVGHSVGAYAALAAARRAPERIDRLILEDLAAPPRRASPMGPLGMVRVATAAAIILAKRRDYELRAVTSFVRQLARPDPAWWAGLGDVPHPTLVVSGGPTSYIPPDRLADVTAALPNARMSTIPVGHRVHSLAPERFSADVLAFLAAVDVTLTTPTRGGGR